MVENLLIVSNPFKAKELLKIAESIWLQYMVDSSSICAYLLPDVIKMESMWFTQDPLRFDRLRPNQKEKPDNYETCL